MSECIQDRVSAWISSRLGLRTKAKVLASGLAGFQLEVSVQTNRTLRIASTEIVEQLETGIVPQLRESSMLPSDLYLS